MNLIKKYWYMLLLLLILLIVVIIYFTGKDAKSNLEEPNENKNSGNQKIVEYAEDYFNNFVNIIGTDEYNVTIEMLKNAVTLQLADYNTSVLEKCEDTSYATIILKPGETNPERIESHFVCN